MTERDISAAAPADEPIGDIGDQAQRLQMAEEQEAIRAALAGRPVGDDELDRAPEVAGLEGPDPLEDPRERDSSDDAVYGGDDITGDDLDETDETDVEQLAADDEL